MNTNRVIKILPDETIEKISAGEAIERPASVVKELVENSFDARAKTITVEIEGAGKKLIRVSDDGEGIGREDLPMVFLRHATSKISRYEDIFNLKTMGFRGEALASISAVADVTVVSATADREGWSINSNYGKISGISPAAARKGTTVTVKNLFFNTPVRLKFLKSDGTEKNLIIKILQAAAIANPATALELKIDGKTAFNLLPEEMEKRIESVLKSAVFSGMTKFSGNGADFQISGFVSVAGHSAASRDFQYIFVNSRPVESRNLAHSVYEASREILPRGRHPAFVLFIIAEPSTIDVNVHPTKREVKFSNEKEVYAEILKAVKASLQSSPNVSYYPVSLPDSAAERQLKEAVRQHYDISANSGAVLFDESVLKPAIKYLCDAFDYCIIAMGENALYIIDAHAAQERVLYEKYKSEEKNVRVQSLLEPILINLPADRFHSVSEKIGLLKSLGWQIEPFGESTLRCNGVPSLFGMSSPYEIINELITIIEKNNEVNADELIKKACRLAVRGREKLNYLDAQKLVNELFSTPNYQTCPHGRPTVISITRPEINAKFKR